MTPDEARELLDGDFATEKRTEWLGNSQADFDSFTGAHIRSTPGDIALAEAAPNLAETVAGMAWEYAVQVEDVDGGWRTLNDGWLSEHEACARRDGIPGTRARIVRRLVSDVEVVE